MKLHEWGAALAGDRGVLVPKMQDLIETHIQASLKTAQILLEDRLQRILAASLGTKLLARRVHGSSTTTSFREPISRHSLYRVVIISPVIHYCMAEWSSSQTCSQTVTAR